ncbi:MAG TPA: hypothetical protein VLA89_00290 [Gemmatimonadales bacterium]|nr:hypothetical protein [Gemmatimonadales bacterium]
MALKNWPANPDPWLEDWTVWRIVSGKTADRPSGAPTKIPEYGFEFLYWAIWRRKGRPQPRPNVTTNIPAWAYAELDKVNKRAPIAIPSPPDDYILGWAIWRFKNSPPDQKPVNIPPEISVAAPYCWSFLNWAAWQRARFSNPSAPRPKNIPASIPSWCWDHLRKINQAVPLGPPPPPPPPPDPDKDPNSWTLPNPMLYTTWGWQSDWVADNTMLQKAKAAGIKTIGLQGGQYGPDVPGRCRAFGMKTFLWGRARAQDAEDLAVGKLDGYMPQIEGPGEHVDAMTQLRAGTGRGLSLGTVTTLGAFTTFIRLPPTQSHPEGKLTTVEVEELRAVGVTYGSVEVYVQEGPHFPISRMMWSADQRGLQWFEPLIGLYHETSLDAYRPSTDPNSLDACGKQLGFYMAEGFIPQNWTEIAELGT